MESGKGGVKKEAETSWQGCSNIPGERQLVWTREVDGSEHERSEETGDAFQRKIWEDLLVNWMRETHRSRRKGHFWLSNSVTLVGRTDCEKKSRVAFWTELGMFIRHVERFRSSWVISRLRGNGQWWRETCWLSPASKWCPLPWCQLRSHRQGVYTGRRGPRARPIYSKY